MYQIIFLIFAAPYLFFGRVIFCLFAKKPLESIGTSGLLAVFAAPIFAFIFIVSLSVWLANGSLFFFWLVILSGVQTSSYIALFQYQVYWVNKERNK